MEVSLLLDIRLDIFSPSLPIAFHLLNIVILKADFNFNEVQSYFYFNNIFDIIFKKSLLNAGSQLLYPRFPSRIFMVLGFPLVFVIHVDYILTVTVDKDSSSYIA